MEKLKEIENYTEKIALKALEVAFIAQEYFKVIKWSNHVLMNPKYEKSIRGLMVRARTYLAIEEYERALEDLKMIKMVHPQFPIIDKEIEYATKLKEAQDKQKEAMQERIRAKALQ